MNPEIISNNPHLVGFDTSLDELIIPVLDSKTNLVKQVNLEDLKKLLTDKTVKRI